MDWLLRFFSSRSTLDEVRREQQASETLTLVNDFKRDLRRDIDERRQELRFPLDSVRMDDDDA